MARLLDVLLIDPRDNVCVATRPLKAGAEIECGRVRFVLSRDVSIGAKLALADLAPGTPIRKYGEVIGTLTQAVPRGGYVHTHNLGSNYLPAHGRDNQAGSTQN